MPISLSPVVYIAIESCQDLALSKDKVIQRKHLNLE